MEKRIVLLEPMEGDDGESALMPRWNGRLVLFRKEWEEQKKLVDTFYKSATDSQVAVANAKMNGGQQ